MEENRQNIRYSEIGRVDAPEICALNGVLDDISATGCKIHFPCPVVLDIENEYKLKITLSRASDEPPLQLLCKPMWVNEIGGSTQIGFQNLYSPDENRLHEFISYLHQLSQDDNPEIL